MVSFDISDMYPSLSKNEVVQEVVRRVNETEFKPNIEKQVLIQLIWLSVKFMSFKINSKFYGQV